MSNPTSQIIIGNSVDVLKTLPPASVQMCVTSPPYFGLRDYQVAGQIGLEKTVAEYIEKLVEVFAGVHRVLRNDGCLWLNLGDTYANFKDCKSVGQSLAKGTSRETAHVIEKGQSHTRDTKTLKAQGYKNKEIMGIPWRVAFALSDAGWYLRQDIVWNKPNPMPESVTDRCTKSHEYIFLLTKSDRYYFDNEAIKETAKRPNEFQTFGGAKARNGSILEGDPRFRNGSEQWGRTIQTPEKRNRRSVWTVNLKPFSEAHFATFPEKLIEPCIFAGSREGDTVLDPFSGAGTSGVVSMRYGRNYIGIELNETYARMSEQRINAVIQPLFAV